MPHRQALYRTYNRYWNSFYGSDHVKEPSDFALFVRHHYLAEGESLLELGCGNGRDACFFAGSGIEVTGIDLSEQAITSCRAQTSRSTFLVGDFSELLTQQVYDHVYSRFTFHAVDEKAEKRAMLNAHVHLKENGFLFIEARTVLDELCGQGEMVSEHEWIHDGHYRRFLVPEGILTRARKAGFSPCYILMSKGLARWKDQDPMVIRLVLRKNPVVALTVQVA